MSHKSKDLKLTKQKYIQTDSVKIAGMNARIVLSWVDFLSETLTWKNGQNKAEHSTWLLLLTEKTVTG